MASYGKSREELTREAMDSPKKIDITVDMDIPRSMIKFDETKHKYKCSCCGKGFTVQKGNFQKTNSPLFQSNDGYLPWCKGCTDIYVSKLTAFYSGNEAHAIEHFCIQADWVYDFEPLKASREISSDRSRISNYSAKKNLNVGGRKTYIDTLKENFKQNQSNVITSKEEAISNSEISGSAIDRWGVGFEEQDYKNLDEHYKLLKKNNPNADNNQEIFIKSLCRLNMLMIRNLKEGNSDKYVKLTEQYAKTFKDAGLKTIEEKDSSNTDAFGVTLGLISQYTPEEFYKDKEIYQDRDGIKDYIVRHIFRPIKNIITGEDERDYEYYVPEGDEDE